MPAVLEPLKLQRQVVRRIGAAVTQRVVMAQYTAAGGSCYTCGDACGGSAGCDTVVCATQDYTQCNCPAYTDGCDTNACGTNGCATDGCDTQNGCIIIPETNFCTIPTTQCFP